jgi:hypothetical protein
VSSLTLISLDGIDCNLAVLSIDFDVSSFGLAPFSVSDLLFDEDTGQIFGTARRWPRYRVPLAQHCPPLTSQLHQAFRPSPSVSPVCGFEQETHMVFREYYTSDHEKLRDPLPGFALRHDQHLPHQEG